VRDARRCEMSYRPPLGRDCPNFTVQESCVPHLRRGFIATNRGPRQLCWWGELGWAIVRSTIRSSGCRESQDFCCREDGATRLWWFGQMCATRPRYQLFLSGEGKVSSGFRYLKNHPAEAVERKPKPTRRITVTTTPTVNVIMLPPWS